MKITRIEAIPLKSPVASLRLNAGVREQTIAVLPVIVKVHTDAGIVGLGETLTYDPSGGDALYTVRGVESLAPHLLGSDPLHVTRRWLEMYQFAKRTGAFKPLSALDQALWDICGKDAGKPVYRLLGGEAGPVGAYATFPHQRSTAELVASGRRLAECGFRCLKVSVGGPVAEESKRLRRLVEGLPDGFGLAIDANTSYSFAEAVRLGRVADELELDWFEEPIRHTDVQGQAELNRRLNVPIAAFQSHHSHYDAVDHLRQNALEIYQPSLYICGGITAAHRIACMVEAFDKRLVPHAFGPLINYSASLHVAAASPACELIEFAIYGTDDGDDPRRYVASPYIANQEAFRVREDGTIRPPELPGLGVELDEEAVEALRLEPDAPQPGGRSGEPGRRAGEPGR